MDSALALAGAGVLAVTLMAPGAAAARPASTGPDARDDAYRSRGAPRFTPTGRST
ncbi:MAG TPA: hypothetical protein VGB74_09885 [Actinoplanes sp.]